MKKNYIGLKFGWIKCWHFEDDFIKKHRDLIDKLCNLDEEVCNKHYSMFEISENRTDKERENLLLCELLDKFLDTKEVTIYNDFYCKEYRSKNTYRKYLLSKNK